MASKFGSLWIQIGANSAKFSAELKKTTALTKRWAVSIRKAVSFGAKAFGVVTAAITATVGALLALYKWQANNIDVAAKHAAKIGDLTANVLAVRHAADFAGVGASIDTAMQRLVRRMGEAANGTGEALKAVKQLGLDAGEIARKTATEQLQIVLDKLQEIPPGAERVRLAFKFFDTEGVGLVNLTSQAIQDAREELERWGATVTEQQAAWVEATNDQLSRLGKFASAAGTQFSTKLAPYIGVAATKLLELAEQYINWGKVTDFVIGIVRKAWVGFMVSVDSIRAVWNFVETGFLQMIRVVLQGFERLEQGALRIANLIPKVDFDLDNTKLDQWIGWIDERLTANVKDFEGSVQRLGSVWSGGFEGSLYMDELNSALSTNKALAEAAKKAQIDLQNSLRLGGALAANDPDGGTQTAAAAKARQKKLSEEARAAAKAAAAAQKAEMRALAKETAAVNSEIQTMAQRIGQGLEDSAARGSEAIREMVADVLIQLARLKLQKLFGGALGGGGAETSFLSGLFGAIGLGAPSAPAGTGAATASLAAGSTPAGYSKQVINVYATGESSSAISGLRAGVRQLSDASPHQVAALAGRGGSYAQSLGGR